MKNVQIPKFAGTLIRLLASQYNYAFRTTLKLPEEKERKEKNEKEMKKSRENKGQIEDKQPKIENVSEIEEKEESEYTTEEVKWLYDCDMLLKDFQLKQFLHARGINLRYLGLVKKCLDRYYMENLQIESVDLRATVDARKLVFIEMCARTVCIC